MPSATTPAVEPAALGRLARSEFAGLSDARRGRGCGAIENAAVLRRLTQELSTAATVHLHHGRMVDLLQMARSTISFKAGHRFCAANMHGSCANFRKRGSSGASNDTTVRNDAGNAMFGESGRVSDAGRRLREFGVEGHREFQPAMRPRYAAVDFGHCRNGGKHVRSFHCRCDSFEVVVGLMGRAKGYPWPVPGLREVSATCVQLGKFVSCCNPHGMKKIHDHAKKSAGDGRHAALVEKHARRFAVACP